MQLQVLDAARDASAWHSVLESLPESLQDIYFTPEYTALNCSYPGSRALLFAYADGDFLWAYPFLLQPILRIGEHFLDRGWFDLETPYGYGGPLANTEDSRFLESANAAFLRWCRENDVVAEFIRLHPLLSNQRWLDPRVQLVYDRDTLSLRLNGFTGNNPPFSSTTRNIMKRAERLGVRVVTCSASIDLGRFVELYHRTMERIQADKFYNFSDDYFRGLGQLMEERGWLLAAELEGQWVAAAVFLRGTIWMHYHLSASRQIGHVPGATNQILYTAAKVGSTRGIKQLHLGGGRTNLPSDSLLKFKQTMATDTHAFFIGRRIHNQVAYASLRELWAQMYPALETRFGHRLLCYRHTM